MSTAARPGPGANRARFAKRPTDTLLRRLRTTEQRAHLVRVGDESIPEADLTRIERWLRDLRQEMYDNLGGLENLTATKRILVEATINTATILQSLDAYILALASEGSLVNRRNRRAYSVLADRARVADSLTRQLQVLGLDRVPRRAPTLHDFLAARSGNGAPQDGIPTSDPDPSPGPAAEDTPSG